MRVYVLIVVILRKPPYHFCRVALTMVWGKNLMTTLSRVTPIIYQISFCVFVVKDLISSKTFVQIQYYDLSSHSFIWVFLLETVGDLSNCTEWYGALSITTTHFLFNTTKAGISSLSIQFWKNASSIDLKIQIDFLRLEL